MQGIPLNGGLIRGVAVADRAPKELVPVFEVHRLDRLHLGIHDVADGHGGLCRPAASAVTDDGFDLVVGHFIRVGAFVESRFGLNEVGRWVVVRTVRTDGDRAVLTHRLAVVQGRIRVLDGWTVATLGKHLLFCRRSGVRAADGDLS